MYAMRLYFVEATLSYWDAYFQTLGTLESLHWRIVVFVASTSSPSFDVAPIMLRISMETNCKTIEHHFMNPKVVLQCHSGKWPKIPKATEIKKVAISTQRGGIRLCFETRPASGVITFVSLASGSSNVASRPS
ncbi:unnamed protein product [Nesidiocoris tenuis]|uniref:Uncharacterized protein n=1 Tax=Nesidiocoris tenuis TaxID=355587 RepID=A0A6H5GSS2_9HEMI|nr:unnamed protein product [Nesidiocoris tenuis]